MKRHVEKLLTRYLGYFPCVGIVGPRQCGKTTLLGELPAEWKKFDLEVARHFQQIESDPDHFLRVHPEHIAIDEAQQLPALFPALRVAVDDDRSRKGRYVVTGSSSPELVKSLTESLAGRIGTIEMGPFSCSEAYALPLGAFFDILADHPTLARFQEQLKPRLDLPRIHDYWLRGGYPEPWINGSEGFRRAWMDQYLQSYLQRDVLRLFPGLNAARFRIFLQMLSNLSGTIINYSDVARALGVSPPTVRDYFEIAHGSFFWRTMPAYTQNTTKRVVKHPRGHFRDSGLLHHWLQIDSVDKLLGHPQVGRSWEGMVTEEILRGLSAHGMAYQYAYYRTRAGAEIDLVLEGPFGLLPVEIKHTSQIPRSTVQTLREFLAERGGTFALVIYNGNDFVRLDSSILAIPFSCL